MCQRSSSQRAASTRDASNSYHPSTSSYSPSVPPNYNSAQTSSLRPMADSQSTSQASSVQRETKSKTSQSCNSVQKGNARRPSMRKYVGSRRQTTGWPNTSYPGSMLLDAMPTASRQQTTTTTRTGATASRSRPRTSTLTYNETSGASQIICATTESRGASPTVGLAYVDLATSRVVLCQIADNQTYTRTIHSLFVREPAVLLVPTTAVSPARSKLVLFLDASPDVNAEPAVIDRKYFSEADGADFISQLALEDDVESVKVAVEGKYYAIACLSAALQYIRYYMDIFFAANSLRVVFEPSEGSMMIDLSTIHSLEVIQNLHDHRSKDCLFGLLNETLTPMGSRLLRSNILQPIVDEDVLQKRYEAVAELSSKEHTFVGVRNALRGFLDVDRALTDILLVPGQRKIEEWMRQNINRVLVIKSYISSIGPVYEALRSVESEILRQILHSCEENTYIAITNLLHEYINDDVAYSRKPVELEAQCTYAVRSGTNGLLDVARQVYRETLDDIHEECAELTSAHGLDFRLCFDKRRGRYLKLPARELEGRSLDPETFIHVVRTKGNIECQTMCLVKLNNKLACTQTEIMDMNTMAVQGLIENIRLLLAPLFRISDSLALLDVLASFAYVSSRFDYVKPRFGTSFAIKAARHPVRIKISSSKFIPNDCYAGENSRLQIITGCNMSGKSTYIRTIALLQIMAQIGCFVPADYASLPIRHQLCARVSTDDNLSANVSTFAAEMREMAFILRNIDARSLVIVDELGRGTSTTDGLAVAIAIAEALLDSRANVWFVTHFHELASFLADYPGVANLHLAVEMRANEEQMLMLYKVASGPVERTSYGIDMAQVMNLPQIIIDDARAAAEFFRRKERGARSSRHAQIQTKKVKLLLGLQDQLGFAKESPMQGVELRVWLKELQDEFVIRLDELQREEEEEEEEENEEEREETASADLRDIPPSSLPSMPLPLSPPLMPSTSIYPSSRHSESEHGRNEPSATITMSDKVAAVGFWIEAPHDLLQNRQQQQQQQQQQRRATQQTNLPVRYLMSGAMMRDADGETNVEPSGVSSDLLISHSDEESLDEEMSY